MSKTDRERPPSTASDGDPFGAIRKLPVTRRADRVVEQIRELVLAEAIPVGDRLPPERTLAERFGTSRAIVSQALRTLSIMGLIEIRPGSGAYVTRNPGAMVTSSVDLMLQTQAGDPEEIAELRYWLETIGVVEALERLDAGGLEAVEATLDKMAASRGRLSSWIVADTEFHGALVRAAGNRYLTAMYESIHTSVISVTYDSWIKQDRAPRWFTHDFEAQIALHRAILEALRVGDHEALTDALADHQRALIDHLGNRAS